jgi:hypothetical protein
LNRLSGRGHRRYVFPNGVRCVINDKHQVQFVVGEREIHKDPWFYEDIRAALAYDPEGKLVIVVDRLARYIREELGRLTFVGARLYSSLLRGGN